MKNLTMIVTIAILAFGLVFLTGSSLSAQTSTNSGKNFVDRDGDGINDSAPDHDGDGIPNGQDPDWEKFAQDGDGYKHAFAWKGTAEPKIQNKFQLKSQRFHQVRVCSQSTFQYRYGYTYQGENGGVGDAKGPQAGNGPCDGSGSKGTGGKQ
ncbi:MAG: hypothetical protein OEW00_05955 [candidate division Zixibacteria bacterium]|nr:hypothetical protein [candidate division Zixibacteria bacterium]